MGRDDATGVERAMAAWRNLRPPGAVSQGALDAHARLGLLSSLDARAHKGLAPTRAGQLPLTPAVSVGGG